MPQRPPHIPNVIERSILQRMSFTRGIPPEQMRAGEKVIFRLLAKGWIEKQPDGRTFCITTTGDEALKAIIPVKRYIYKTQ